LEKINKEKGREIVKKKCDNEQSKMDIEDGEDRMEGVEEEI